MDHPWFFARRDNYHAAIDQRFNGIADHRTSSRPVPAEFGIEGYLFRHDRHFVYWRWLSNGDIGIVTILHERMHQIDRFRDDFGV